MIRRNLLVGGGVALVGAGTVGFQLERLGSMSAYTAAMADLRAPLSGRPTPRDLIRFATLAANGHNTQPWQFRTEGLQVQIRPDWSRRTPVVDPDDHHLFVSLGCATENIVLAAGQAGFRNRVRFDPSNGGLVIVDLEPRETQRPALFAAISRRQSSRTEYNGQPVGADDIAALANAARAPGVELAIITDKRRMDLVRDLVVAGDSVQMADRAFVAELKHWLRFNPRQALTTGDGLFSVASGNPSLPSWAGPTAFDLLVSAKTENDKYARQLRSSAGIAIFVAASSDAAHWVQVGRACQRFALQATLLGLKHAFINQPVEVASLRPHLADLAGAAGRRPDLLMRFGYGPSLPYSPRRTVTAVLQT